MVVLNLKLLQQLTQKSWLRLLPVMAVVCMIHACGSKSEDEGSGAAVSSIIPDYLENLPTYEESDGTLSVKALLIGADGDGTVLVKLLSNKPATISYSFVDQARFGKIKASDYKEPLHLRPPGVITAQSSEGDETSELMTFIVSSGGKITPLLEPRTSTRLPQPPILTTEVFTSPETKTFIELAPEDSFSFKADGDCQEWPESERLELLDAPFDVPSLYSSTDLTRIRAVLTDTHLMTALETTGGPKASQFASYGLEIGQSGVTSQSFGTGATYLYKFDWQNKELKVSDRASGKELTWADKVSVSHGTCLEVAIPRDQMSELAGRTDLILRAFAADWSLGTTVFDRTEPLYLQPDLKVTRGSIDLPGERGMVIDFFTDKDPSAAADFLGNYFSFAAPALTEMEKIGQLPFYQTGTIPLVFAEKEEDGYAGLNTTDRGTLTTVGTNTSTMARIQLFSHEFAHFMNARSSTLSLRWLQEGHSEWIAERTLLSLLPTRAVHKFLHQLRYNKYFEETTSGDSFPLAAWGTEPSAFGYEKSLLFMNLLESELGTEGFRSIFSSALNLGLDESSLLALFMTEQGESLENLFKFWVQEGVVDDEFDPLNVFGDDDQDGLMNIDEKNLGTDPQKGDSDQDGYLDSEEYYAGKDPLSPVVTEVAIVAPSSDNPSPLLRIQGLSATETIGLHPFATSNGATRDGEPIVGYPPFDLALKTESGLSRLSVPLYNNGTAYSPVYREDPFAPNPVIGSFQKSVPTIISTARILDHEGDVPAFVSDLDVTEWSYEFTEEGLEITIKTRGELGPYSSYGDIVLAFEHFNWTDEGAETFRDYAFTASLGVPYWFEYSGANESAEIMPNPDALQYNDGNLLVTIPSALYEDWLTAGDERVLCLTSQIDYDNLLSQKDRAGCFTIETDEFIRSRYEVESAFESSRDRRHELELFIETNDHTAQREADISAMMASAIGSFENVLQRPLLDRNHWPLHVYFMPAGSPTFGSASSTSGAWLSARETLWQSSFLFLVSEQLARLQISDLLNRQGSARFFVQEMYIQWLTAAAAYDALPTTDVDAFHLGRINDYKCYATNQAGCSALFDADLPLDQWDFTTNGSTGSVKSLMFLLVLEKHLGAESLGSMFSGFSNFLPVAEQMEEWLIGLNPDKAVLIQQLFVTWVYGSGDAAADTAAILAEFP